MRDEMSNKTKTYLITFVFVCFSMRLTLCRVHVSECVLLSVGSIGRMVHAMVNDNGPRTR